MTATNQDKDLKELNRLAAMNPAQLKEAEKQQDSKDPLRPSFRDTDTGQPVEVPKDEPEELIRRFYTGGLPREEFATRMKAIGADFDFDMPPALPAQLNPDPTQPGADAAKKYPGATHKL
jgi:hypothetical protein